MRHARIAELTGRISRLGLTIMAVGLMLMSAVRAADIKELTEKLPRAYIGEFQWDGDNTVQNVVITFDTVKVLNEQTAEALGCGSYDAGRRVTKIGVQMFIRLSDREIEILERPSDSNGAFETGGSHRGKLSEDLQQIDAQWTTTANGLHGQLHLHAAASAACEPAADL